MNTRWNPDNPTSSAAFSPNAAYYHMARTPTPSRRRASHHLASSVFTSLSLPPAMRGAPLRSPATDPEGACETKQTAFEWPVHDVRGLQLQLLAGEDAEDAEDENRHEALATEGAYFDDQAYKLHIERSPDSHAQGATSNDDSDDTATVQAEPAEPTLTLMVIALWVKYSELPQDDIFERNVFIGLKALEREGDRALGEPKWFWTSSALAEFSRRQEYYEVAIPPLSTLLDIPAVSAQNAFAIRVIVKHSSEPTLPPMVHADQQFISRRITRQAAGFLDSMRTGDVQFVCLEHASAGTPDVDGGRRMVRRRVIYAHSELLVHSDYFRSVLKGGFSESQSSATTLVVDDAAFNTVYWVLRWLYTDEIMFSNNASVRAVMAQVRIDKNAARKVLNNESWDYASLEDDAESVEELRTVRSNSSVGTANSAAASGRRSPGGRSSTSTTSGPPPAISRRTSDTRTAIPTQVPAPRIPRPKSSSPASGNHRSTARSGLPGSGRSTAATSPTTLRIATNTARKTTTPVKSPTVGGSTSPPARTIPRRSHAPLDPNPHPTEAPIPPPPLAVFFLAHRYGLDELQTIARDALLRRLTPESCVASLLATYEFPSLHAAIMDYVSDNWADVSASPELDRCYQEVSAGVWGEFNGGQVLLGLTKRLTGMAT